MSGLAARQLPRGGHRCPASGRAERRVRSPGEQRARHSTPPVTTTGASAPAAES